MSATLWQQIPMDVVDQAIAQTFLMLVESDAVPGAPFSDGGSDDISMAVYCDDAQQSAVIARCTKPLALMLTSRMLETPADSLDETDINDAAGEVVNVIAGSLRGLIENPSAMSTPFSIAPHELDALACYDQRTYLIDCQPFTLYRL